MKGLFISIFTFIIVWALYGIFFNDFEEDILFLTIVGIITGYNIGKRQVINVDVESISSIISELICNKIGSF